jgi:hypothetical protein
MDEFNQIGIEDLYKAISERQSCLALVNDAYAHGVNISRWLEVCNQTDERDVVLGPNGFVYTQGDAFDRLMEQANITTRSDLRNGIVASRANEAFLDNGVAGRFLLSEFFARQWRNVSYGNRAVYLSSDATVGSWERPYAESQSIMWENVPTPPIPLAELVAVTTPVDQDIVRSAYLNYDAAELRMYRVGETADIPLAKLTEREVTINLFKYGRGLLASYEQMRRMRVDRLAFHIQGMAIQSEIDKVSTVLDILINGDGNTDTAAQVLNMTTLNPDATAGTLDLKSWLAFEMEFGEEASIMTTALMQKAVALQLRLLQMPTANVPIATVPLGAAINNLTPINTTLNGIRFGWTSEAPALKVVAFDRRRAIERFVETGSSITEMERIISNQTEVIYMTEVEGYGVIDPDAAKILDVNA